MSSADALQAIWEQSRSEVLEQVEAISSAITDALAGALTQETRTGAAAEAHKLAGSVGSLGFGIASDHARELERALKLPDGPVTADLPRLAELALALRRELETERALAAVIDDGESRDDRPAEILFVATDPGRLRALGAEAQLRGLQAALAGDLRAAQRMIAQAFPGVVVLQLDRGCDQQEALRFVSEVSPGRPVLVLAASGEQIDPVELARRGGRGLLSGSLDPGSVLAAALDLRDSERVAGTRALLVDDDPLFLAALRLVLERAGFEVSTCEHPELFWDRLQRVRPEIVVMDFEMPQISGPDLCRAMRNDPVWARIPVLFLTSRAEPDAVRAVFDAGGDDVLTKPFVAPEVVARMRNRLERARRHRSSAEHASLSAGRMPAGGPAQVDVVIVEDDAVLARLLVHALETRGYRTRLLTDGELAVAELGATEPGLVAPLLLLDWDLPGLDGMRVLRALRERGVLERTRVIMLTARGTETEVLEALEGGAVDHVTKPFSVPVLMQRVRRAIER